MGASDELIDYVIPYFEPMLLGSTFLTLSVLIGMFLRVDGAPVFAMICTIVATVINIFLDYIFIFVLKIGMFGAGLATVIGGVVSFIMAMVYFLHYSSNIKFTKREINFKLISRIVPIGFPG